MKRLRENKIDDAAYYEPLWKDEVTSGRGHYDAVRQRALASKVKLYDTVCDLGAGVYGTAQFIAEVLKIPCSLAAYDQSYTAKEIVDKLHLPIFYFLGDLPHTLFPNNFFDVVIAGEVIEHMEYPPALVQEMARICRSKGWISISTVDTTCEQAIAHGPYPEHIYSFEDIDLINMFTPYGRVWFEIVGNYQMVHCQKS